MGIMDDDNRNKQPGKSRRNVGQKFSTLGLKTKNFTHVLVYAVKQQNRLQFGVNHKD